MAFAKSIPSITLNMIVDLLDSEEIVSSPACLSRSFKWVSSMRWEKGVVPEQDMIIVCQDKAAEQTATLYPQSFLIVLADGEPAQALEKVLHQALVIKHSAASVNLLQKLQNYFLSIQAWLNELNRAPASHEGIRTALQKSSVMLEAPLLLYGADLSLAEKSGFNAAMPLCKTFLLREKEVLNSVSTLHRPLVSLKGTSGSIYVENGLIQSEGNDPLYALALHEKAPTAGQRDLFKMFADVLSLKAGKAFGRLPTSQYSTYSLFNALICGRYIGQGQLNDFAFATGLPLDSEFRLLCFKFNEERPENDPTELMEPVRRLNEGKCLIAEYEGDLLALLHSKSLDSSLSNLTIENQLQGLSGSFDGFVTVSQVFDGISHLKLAYQETQLVAKCKGIVDFEQYFTVAERKKRKNVYTYEECLRFCILDFDEMSQELKDFSFSHTILEKTLAEDAENGTNDIRILATYIHYERKATVVAEKLHMHRNTVLYRIGKIERRFGLNLDESWSRERVLLDFSIFYNKIMRNPELARAILGQDVPSLLPTLA